MFYSVGGLTARPDREKDVHMNWKSIVPLRVGGVQVKVLESKNADRPRSRKRASASPRDRRCHGGHGGTVIAAEAASRNGYSTRTS